MRPGATGGLHVERHGQGAPLLLLHGLGASARYWERLIPLMCQRHTVIAPDLLGFGRSPKPNDSAYDVETHIAALHPLVSAGTTLVGHSAGAVLATALAVASPTLVGRLVLIGLPAYPSATIARADIGRLGLLARLTVAGSFWARVMCETMCALRPVAITLGPLVVRDLPREIVQDGARHTWRSYSRTLMRVVVGHRVLPDLSRVNVPTLVVHGRSDREAPIAHVKATLRDRRAARADLDLCVLDGDHHLAVRSPEVIAQLIEHHISGAK